MSGRIQFNVVLLPELVRRVKDHAAQQQVPTARLAERLIADGVAMLDAHATGKAPPPVVHVSDAAAATCFLRSLGAEVAGGSRDGSVVMMVISGQHLFLIEDRAVLGGGASRTRFTLDVVDGHDELYRQLVMDWVLPGPRQPWSGTENEPVEGGACLDVP